MQSRADIGITRSASDVLQSMVGVCRDYGILFAGLARGAGIPTRIAAGVLYVKRRFLLSCMGGVFRGRMGSIRRHAHD